MSGFGTSMSKGFPDAGLLTQTEMVQNARSIVQAVSAPVIADADTGYGNPINVWRTVREYEAAGVAAIHVEDQVFPKRCGFFAGKDVIPLEDAIQKVRAAVDARSDPSFTIIARTDALAVHGWDETVRRCRAFRDAGADLLFVDGIQTADDLHDYAHNLGDLPLLYNGGALPRRRRREPRLQGPDPPRPHVRRLSYRQGCHGGAHGARCPRSGALRRQSDRPHGDC